MMKPIIPVLLVLGLASCASTQTKYVYVSTPKTPVIEPQTMPVNMRNVEWKVLTKKELQETLDELEKNPDPKFALFALTPKGFEALNSNLVEINRFMQEQNEVIAYYRAYTKGDAEVPVPADKPKS